MTIPTPALRQLAEASAAHVADPNNDNYATYLLCQAELAWGSPATVAAVSGELVRLRALRDASIRARESKKTYAAACLDGELDYLEILRALDAETEARVALEAALRECE